MHIYGGAWPAAVPQMMATYTALLSIRKYMIVFFNLPAHVSCQVFVGLRSLDVIVHATQSAYGWRALNMVKCAASSFWRAHYSSACVLSSLIDAQPVRCLSAMDKCLDPFQEGAAFPGLCIITSSYGSTIRLNRSWHVLILQSVSVKCRCSSGGFVFFVKIANT